MLILHSKYICHHSEEEEIYTKKSLQLSHHDRRLVNKNCNFISTLSIGYTQKDYKVQIDVLSMNWTRFHLIAILTLILFLHVHGKDQIKSVILN